MSSFQWFPMTILEAQFAPSYQLDSISDGSGISQIGFLGTQKLYLGKAYLHWNANWFLKIQIQNNQIFSTYPDPSLYLDNMDMASPARPRRNIPPVLAGRSSTFCNNRQSPAASNHNLAFLAASAGLSSSTHSLDSYPHPQQPYFPQSPQQQQHNYPSPQSPQKFARSPGPQRFNSYGTPPPSPAHSAAAGGGGMYSPRHGANLYWTARVSL